MFKFVFAVAAFAAVANQALASYNRYDGGHSSVVYQPVQIEADYGNAPTYSSGYNAPLVRSYAAPVLKTYATQPTIRGHPIGLTPIAIRSDYNNNYGAVRSVPSLLIAENQRPKASSAAAVANQQLRPGTYTQLAVPSYQLLTGVRTALNGGIRTAKISHPGLSSGLGHGLSHGLGRGLSY